MKILVTGGAGFIGSNFVRYWLKKYPKDKIVNLDKLTYAGHVSSTKDFSKNKNLPAGKAGYKFVKGDILDTKLVDKLTKKTDLIVHFAAESHVDRSIAGPQIFLKTNVMGTQVLLDAAIKNNVKHFHHVSTDEVFGDLDLGTKEKFSEKTNYNPHSPYAASKAASDHLVRAYGKTYGLNFTITNCSNNFGPYQDPEKFLPRMITNLLTGLPMTIYGDGKYVRDWLHVEDHCRAIDLVVKKGKVGETYLVGGQTKEVSNIEIAENLLKIFRKDKSHIKYVKDRRGHDRKYAVDWRKINKELGWEPEHDFGQWLEETVKWYTANEWWWRPLKAKAEALYKKTGQV